jgi:LemA protein
VRDYNTSLRTFPTVIWAKTFQAGSKPMQLFTASAEAQNAPDRHLQRRPERPPPPGPAERPRRHPGFRARAVKAP